MLATGSDNHWPLNAVGVPLYVAAGWLLWATRGTINDVVLVASLDWVRRRITRPQTG